MCQKGKEFQVWHLGELSIQLELGPDPEGLYYMWAWDSVQEVSMRPEAGRDSPGASWWGLGESEVQGISA